MPRKQRLVEAYAVLFIFKKDLPDGDLLGICVRGLEKIKYHYLAEED